MMPKRVFNNLSNFQIAVGTDNRLGLKRVSVDQAQCPITAKKSKPETQGLKGTKNQENGPKLVTLTTTIERKVKSISLRPKATEELKPTVESTSAKSALETENGPKKTENDPKNDKVSATVVVKKDPAKPPKPLRFDSPATLYKPPASLPKDVEDYDQLHIRDIFAEPVYAFDIFQYYRREEVKYLTKKYLHRQTDVNRSMRAILVDWLVEVQQNYTLNHETLYLAVKIIDRYLMQRHCSKADFQLLGVTALLIASKYDVSVHRSYLFIKTNSFLFSLGAYSSSNRRLCI